MIGDTQNSGNTTNDKCCKGINMEIIKRVDIKKNKWIKLHECIRCTSILQIERKDLRYVPVLGNCPNCYFFRCMVCDDGQTILCSEVPYEAT